MKSIEGIFDVVRRSPLRSASCRLSAPKPGVGRRIWWLQGGLAPENAAFVRCPASCVLTELIVVHSYGCYVGGGIANVARLVYGFDDVMAIGTGMVPSIHKGRWSHGSYQLVAATGQRAPRDLV